KGLVEDAVAEHRVGGLLAIDAVAPDVPDVAPVRVDGPSKARSTRQQGRLKVRQRLLQALHASRQHPLNLLILRLLKIDAHMPGGALAQLDLHLRSSVLPTAC